MENNILTAIILALIGMLANSEYLLGSSMLSRPLVTATLTGLVMGDLNAGLTIGASLELAFIGSFSIGGSIPPEIISGSILGTAFAIATGESTGVAISLALPIASLVLILKNLGFVFIMPNFLHKADEYAGDANDKGIGRMNFWSGFFSVNLPIGLAIGLGYALGSPFIEGLLNAIPTFIIDGLQIATGLLPAYGFALLMKMMINKESYVYFILGFILAVYLDIPVTGVAIFAAVLAIIMSQTSNNQSSKATIAEGEIDYDDEEF